MLPVNIRQAAAKFANDNPNASIVSAFLQGYIFAQGSEQSIFPEPQSTTNVPSFDDFYNAFGNKKARKQTERMWDKLSVAKKIQIMQSIPAYLLYIEAENIKQMHPSTYINPANERWLDDHSVKKEPTPTARPVQKVYRNPGLNQDELDYSRQLAERRRQIIEENERKLGIRK